MLRRTLLLSEKMPKQKGKIDLSRELGKGKDRIKFHTRNTTVVDPDAEEEILGKGAHLVHESKKIRDTVKKLEHPIVWIWYPWRKHPESPTPALPCPVAEKNIHGAVWKDLSPKQKSVQEAMVHGANILPRRYEQHARTHPFLAQINSDLKGKAKGFPFWYKLYPTRQHAYARRFSIPNEMLDGYPEPMQTALSAENMSDREKEKAQIALYRERYAEHALDTSSLIVTVVHLLIAIRNLRNRCLLNPHDRIGRVWLKRKERRAMKELRMLRKYDFKKYWELLRDHDMAELIQPPNEVEYRWGGYWRYDWENGYALTTNVADFMDPRGLTGCIETGRSRAEVARDVGLSYTRPLTDAEKRLLEKNALYYENLAKFKSENPQQYKEEQQVEFARKMSSYFVKMSRKNTVADFPGTHRHEIGTKHLRWPRRRHNAEE